MFDLGFGVGAGLGVIALPIIILVMFLDKWIEGRRSPARPSRRTPVSYRATTEEIPVVRENIIDWK
jgi:hypothetical protein